MKSELFIECAKNVVDFYNLTQESIGSKNRMEYPKVIEEVKPRLAWLGEDNDGGFKFYKIFPVHEEWDKITQFVEVIE